MSTNFRSTSSGAVADSPAPSPSNWLRGGAAALLLGGPLSLVFHALWRIGHGPTVVNEHGVVLGLTNDQWSHLGAVWMAPVAFGSLVVCGLERGIVARVAGVLLGSGLLLGAASAWVWVLYSIAALLQYAGLACLAVVIIRGDSMPRWPAGVLATACASFSITVVAPDLLTPIATVAILDQLQGIDLAAAATAGAWISLGLALRVGAPGERVRRLRADVNRSGPARRQGGTKQLRIQEI